MSNFFTGKTYQVQKRKLAKPKRLQWGHILDWVDANPYDDSMHYTKQQLEWYADVMIHRNGGGPKYGILLRDHEVQRLKREIYVVSGIPDPSIEEGLYWRTHPEGRKVNSVERRKAGASYYV